LIVTGVQTCALPILCGARRSGSIARTSDSRCITTTLRLEQRFDLVLRGGRDLRTAGCEVDRDLGAHAELPGEVQPRPDGEAGPRSEERRVGKGWGAA